MGELIAGTKSPLRGSAGSKSVGGGMGRAQLATEIWRACDVMRRDNNCGGIMEYLEHLSWVLFLRFLDEQEEIFEQAARAKGRTYRRLIRTEYRWAKWVPRALGYGDAKSEVWGDERLIGFVRQELIPYLSSLTGRPELDIIASVFSNRNVVVCASAANLREVLRTVDGIDFRGEDDIHTVSHVYEELLRKLGNENKMSGEFYTPRPIIRFMVEVAEPHIGETIYDPACGACGFLTESFEYMRRQERTPTDHAMLQESTFYGQEKKAVPSLLGLMNMLLHGVRSPKLRRVNTLEERISGDAKRFDVILTNPPFGGRENRDIQKNFPVQSNATELLFIQHIMEKVRTEDGGRCALVLPDGALFKNGAFGAVRKKLLTDFDLSLVVCLAPGAFAPYSDVKTAILYFQRPGPTREVLYIGVDPPAGAKKFSRTNPIHEDHFDDARKAWRMWDRYRRSNAKRPTLPPSCHTQAAEDLIHRGYDLSLQLAETEQTSEPFDPSAMVEELTQMNGELQETLSRLHTLLTQPEKP